MKYVPIFGGLFCVAVATLSQSDQKNKEAKTTKEKHGSDDASVFERKLVVPEPLAKSIIAEHSAYHAETSVKRFRGNVLGYVTPWNNHGYDVAKMFANKFTHISPVWLQISPGKDDTYILGGLHDIDRSWMHDVRNASTRGVKIMPRLVFERWASEDLKLLMKSEKQQTQLRNTLVKLAVNYSFDGFVFELWTQFANIVQVDIVVNIVKFLGDAMKENELLSILVIPPMRVNSPSGFTVSHFNILSSYVNSFSLMTYDFSNAMRPGPNSPLVWVKNCVQNIVPVQNAQRSQILTGLNLYGNEYTPNGGGAIIGHQYISFLRKLKGKLKYDSTSEENMFEVKDEKGRHVVFYPTLYSIQKRIELSEQLETGISLWELGQGLDYFFDLF